MAIVTIGSPTKGTGDANMAGFDDAERVSSWTTSIAMSSQTPGQPNGGDNTTAIDELRAQFCADPDDDALCDDVDLCPDDFDPTNADTDADGVGDSCDVPAVLLDAAPGMAGSNNTFTVVDGPLNADVKYYYGSTIGSTSVTLACGTVTMDLQNAKLVGQAVTDASGTAALTTNIPSQLAGKVMQTQAVFPGFCFKTNVDATQF